MRYELFCLVMLVMRVILGLVGGEGGFLVIVLGWVRGIE